MDNEFEKLHNKLMSIDIAKRYILEKSKESDEIWSRIKTKNDVESIKRQLEGYIEDFSKPIKLFDDDIDTLDYKFKSYILAIKKILQSPKTYGYSIDEIKQLIDKINSYHEKIGYIKTKKGMQGD